MKKIYMLLMICCLLIVGCDENNTNKIPTETKYEFQKQFSKDDLDITIYLEKTSVSVTDTLKLKIQATIPEKFNLTFPEINDALDEYELDIISEDTPGPRLGNNSNKTYTYIYTLEPILEGSATIKPMEFSWQLAVVDDITATAKVYTLSTEAIEITITTPLENANADDIADIKGVVDLKTKFKLQWFHYAIAIGLLFIILLLILRTRKGEKAIIYKPVYKTAHAIAYDQLAQLEARGLINEGKLKEFYESLSYILRWYIEYRFKLRAPEMTTEEFLREAVDIANELNNNHTDRLKDFLVHCDMVKFARYQPDASEADKSVLLAKTFIDSTANDECLVDIGMNKGAKDAI
ncbi:MAG: hypothetical protein JEZ07_10645 [Phycisphaerae bacterium]|nr:hypothetical protein [Phycisphaerae bacterium]